MEIAPWPAVNHPPTDVIRPGAWQPLRLLLCALCLAAAPHGARAAPADAFEQGRRAYHQGDVVSAMATLRVPARAGHAPSQALLAFILDRADFAEEAAGLYRQAAEQGDADGQAGLAGLLLVGRGLAKDEKQAYAQFSKAADGGHAFAIEWVAMAWLHQRAGCDAAADPASARAAVQRAAGAGHLPSVEALAQAYRDGGRLGLAADAAEASRWQARAQELRRQRSARPAAARASR